MTTAPNARPLPPTHGCMEALPWAAGASSPPLMRQTSAAHHCNVGVSHDGRQQLRDLFSMGACVSQAKPEDGAHPACERACACVCTWVHVCECVCTCMRAVHVCVFSCAHYMCACACDMCACVCTCVRAHVYMCVRARVCDMCVTCVCVHVHACVHVCACLCVHVLARLHVCL